jgi:hypothetical protein
MFKLIIQILLLIYILLVIQHLLYIQKYNMNGFIIETNDKKKIIDNYVKLNPIFTSKENNFDINNNNYDYLQDILNYKLNKPSYVFKNNELIKRLTKENTFFDISIFDDYNHFFNISKSISIISGKNNIPLIKCVHNINIIGILDGESTFYLFNPKHKDEIKEKDNDKIKKWGHKKKLFKNDILIIPPYWSYIQEIDNKIIQYHIDIDTYFTFIPNFFKDI